MFRMPRMICERWWISVGLTPAAGSSRRSSAGRTASARAISEESLLAVGEILGDLGRLVGDPHHREQGHGPAAEGGLLVDGPPGLGEVGPQAGAQLEVKARHDIVEDRQVGKETDALEGARHPELGHAMRLEPLHRLTAQLNGAGRRLVEAREHVDEGALAGPIGPDEPVNGAGLHGQGHVVQGADPAEVLGQAADGDDGSAGRVREGRIPLCGGGLHHGRPAAKPSEDTRLHETAHDAVGQEDDGHEDDAAIDVEVVLVHLGEDGRDQVEDDAAHERAVEVPLPPMRTEVSSETESPNTKVSLLMKPF